MAGSPPESNEQAPLSGVFIPLQPVDASDAMQFTDWLRDVWSRKLLLCATTAAAVAIAIVVAFLSSPIYRAEVLLAPNSEQADSSFMSGLASQFDTLSSVAGLDLGNDLVVEEAIATLRSRDFTTRFINAQNLMPILFADKWGGDEVGWKDGEDEPTEWDAFELFDKKVRRVSEARNGLYTISIEWSDPQVAASWANSLVADLNELMRGRAIEEASENIAYLQQELQSTSIVELKTAISRLIESQVKKAMLARARDQYSFRVIDPAVVPDADQYVAPDRALIILLGAFVGLLLGIVIAIATRKEPCDPEATV